MEKLQKMLTSNFINKDKIRLELAPKTPKKKPRKHSIISYILPLIIILLICLIFALKIKIK